MIITTSEDIISVAEADTGDRALELAAAHSPDVVLMDLRMPGMDGITATSRLCALPSPPRVIALTTWDVEDAVVRAIAAGASGFLLKTAAPAEILSAIRSVHIGDAVLSPRSTRQLLERMALLSSDPVRRTAREAVARLTDREIDVVREVGKGLSNAQIAQRLFISEATVKTHLATVQMKLAATNRVEVAVIAERAGLLA